MIVTSAPGKVILFGEHAVVYDKLGIVSAVDIRCRVEVIPVAGNKIFIKSNKYNSESSFSKKELFTFYYHIKELVRGRKFNDIEEIYKKDKLAPVFFVLASIFNRYGFKGTEIIINSNIPKGLGSSSAVFSALSLAALKILIPNKISKKEVSGFSYQGDIIAHGGHPSGIDNNAVTYGGYLKYRKSEGFEALRGMPRIDLLIVDSGEQSRTSETVSLVRKMRDNNPGFVNPILDSLNKISGRAVKALKFKDMKRLGGFMVSYYKKLRELGVSTGGLDNIIEISLREGALGAKPTGGWGGGCCLILVEDLKRKETIIKKLKKGNFRVFSIKTASEGVKLHTG